MCVLNQINELKFFDIIKPKYEDKNNISDEMKNELENIRAYLIPEVMYILQLKKAETLYKMINKREISAFKVARGYRILKNEVSKYIERNTV